MEEFAVWDIYIKEIMRKTMCLSLPRFNKFALSIMNEDDLAIIDYDLQTLINVCNDPPKFSILMSMFIETYSKYFDELR